MRHFIEELAFRVSDYNRIRKYQFFMRCFKPGPQTSILDVGASEKEYQENANIIEKRYPYPDRITVLGVDEYMDFNRRYPGVRIVKYDGVKFPFADKEFDICWCNAVLEHVGPRDKQMLFLREIRRVSKTAFVTTPNRLFPFEIHTRFFLLHYLPKKYFDIILKKLGKGWAADNYMHLLAKRDVIRLLKDCGISEYRIFANRIMGLAVDYIIIF